MAGSRCTSSTSDNDRRLLSKLSKLLCRRQYQRLHQPRLLHGPLAKQNIHKQPSNQDLLANRAGSQPELHPSLTNVTGVLSDNTRHDDEASAVPVNASFSNDEAPDEQVYHITLGNFDLETRLNQTLAKVQNDFVEAEDTELKSDTSSFATTLSSMGSSVSTSGGHSLERPILKRNGRNSHNVYTTEDQSNFSMPLDLYPERQSCLSTKVQSTRVPTPISLQGLNSWLAGDINVEALGQRPYSPGTSIGTSMLLNDFESNSPIEPTALEDFRDVRSNLRKVSRNIEVGPSFIKSETNPQATSTLTRIGATKEVKASMDFPKSFSAQAVRTQEIRRHASDPKSGRGSNLFTPTCSGTAIGTQNSASKTIGPRKMSTVFCDPSLKSPVSLEGDKKVALPSQFQKREQPLQFPARKVGDNGELTVVTSQRNRAVVMPPVKDEPQVTPIGPLMVEKTMLNNMKGSSCLTEKRQAPQQQILFPTEINRCNGNSHVAPVWTSEFKQTVLVIPRRQEDARQNWPRAIDKKKNVLAKYYDMKKIGLSIDAIRNAMVRDGIDPSLLDNDPGATNKKPIATKAVGPKDGYRGTNFHWGAHDGISLSTGCTEIKRDPDCSLSRIVGDEFRNPFRSEVGKASFPSIHKVTDHGSVKVINPKRANNGGVFLARVKLSFDEIAQAVDTFDQDAMTPEQIRGIIRFVPTDEETTALTSYLRNSGSSISALSECEKFMVSMISCQHAKRKLQALLFMQGFNSNLEEIRKDAWMVQKASDEIIFSSRFRKLLGIILDHGNGVNAAGSCTNDMARAIAIDSLTKLNPKGLIQNTRFLHHIVEIIRGNGMSYILPFRDEMLTVFKAEKSHWDQSITKMEKLEKELDEVRKLALHISTLPQPSPSKGDDFQTLVTASLSLSREVELLQSSEVGLFTLDACLRMAVLVNEVEKTKGHYKILLRYFGEEDCTLRPDEVFKIISTLSKNIDIALDEVIDQEKAHVK